MNIKRTIAVTVSAKEIVRALLEVEPGSLQLQAMLASGSGAASNLTVEADKGSVTIRHTTGVPEFTQTVFPYTIGDGPQVA